jgi:arylsulfatase A-like enzyme
MPNLRFLALATVGLVFLSRLTAIAFELPPTAPQRIILLYADDVGFGDLSCYGMTATSTLHLDRIAKEGLRFTDAHSTSATCTPSRYALMTGDYPWRRKGTGVLPGNAPLIIEPGRATLASMLREHGYATGVIGKWHLGLGAGDVNWNESIRPNASDVGFEYSFLVPATGDRVPCVYVENDRVVGLDAGDPITVSFKGPIGNEPTGAANPDLLRMHPSHGHDQTIVNGISRIGFMSGGKKARWVDEDMADVLTTQAVRFIERHADEPFFLMFSFHDIHVPRTPHARFQGKSGMGPRGDAILQMDWCVGQILEKLDELKMADDTMIIFSSDNGPVVDDGYRDQAVDLLGTHRPAGPYRGGKYSAFEGGTRVPMIVRWPKLIEPAVSDALISQIDFPASFATVVGAKWDPVKGRDSQDVSAAFLGKSAIGREFLVEHAATYSLRHGHWKYIEAKAGPALYQPTNTESGLSQNPQLYNLADDPGEQNNVAAEQTQRVDELQRVLDEIRASDRQ